ncbi:hypothetical protein GQ53DRAFT_788505 [Thozetella sp. PMI_491]|nr:hypothetical protein GQ53DRAFT_788505 [Thozetella sp. PMI_491]
MAQTEESAVAGAVTLSCADRAASAAASASAPSNSPSVASAGEAKKRRAPRLPFPLQFPLVILLSFALSSLAHSFLHEWTIGELDTIASPPEPASEIALLAAWKIVELALGWFGGYDGYDLAALNLLSHGPYLYLLYSFYGISARAVAAILGVDVLAHSAAPNTPDREVILDRPLQGFTTLLAGVVYSTTLFLACKLFLPSIFVLYFEGIPSIQPAVGATLFGTVPTEILGLLFGLAARVFIFTPAAGTGPTDADLAVANFNPEIATLSETILWNLWGYTSRSKTTIKRTVVAMLVTGVQTFLQCRSLNGVEPFGAAVYAAVWVIGTMLTGESLAYVLAV